MAPQWANTLQSSVFRSVLPEKLGTSTHLRASNRPEYSHSPHNRDFRRFQNVPHLPYGGAALTGLFSHSGNPGPRGLRKSRDGYRVGGRVSAIAALDEGFTVVSNERAIGYEIDELWREIGEEGLGVIRGKCVI